VLDPSTLGVFFGAGFVLLMTPGPAVLCIVTRSIEQGRKAGLVSVLGIVVGTLFHVAAAALGVGAVDVVGARIQRAAVSRRAVSRLSRLQDAAGADRPEDAPAVERRGCADLFSQGVVVNLLNPHTALFFFAFLPQAVDPTRGAVALQIVALGLLFIAMAAMTDSVWAITAGTAGDWIKRNPRFTRAAATSPAARSSASGRGRGDFGEQSKDREVNRRSGG
jgi:threonine/homoserine/homoserine lactone efflux protein